MITLLPELKQEIMTVATRLRQEERKVLIEKMVSAGFIAKDQAEVILKEQ